MQSHDDLDSTYDDNYIEGLFNSWWPEEIDESEQRWEQKWLQGKARRQQKCNEKQLIKYRLPKYNSLQQIAEAMNISREELRLLAFSPKADAATKHHYIRFSIPKKTGGERIISAPTERLKTLQYWILGNILETLEPTIHDAVHGFRSSKITQRGIKKRDGSVFTQYLKRIQFPFVRNLLRKVEVVVNSAFYPLRSPEAISEKRYSIVTNAEPHIGAEVIINIDLKDFFSSISYRRVKGLFKSFGYSESAAKIFGLLCTVTFTNHRSYLPQGAPTSPIITNLICRRLDRRLNQTAVKFGFCYTRYADDLTFSASGGNLCNIRRIIRNTETIVAHEGFEVNKDKINILRRSRRQEVTGVVVNNKLNISREKLKRFRATLYQIEKDGPIDKHWGPSQDVIASIQGFANFVTMVNPQKGKKFREQIRRIKDKHKC